MTARLDQEILAAADAWEAAWNAYLRDRTEAHQWALRDAEAELAAGVRVRRGALRRADER